MSDFVFGSSPETAVEVTSIGQLRALIDAAEAGGMERLEFLGRRSTQEQMAIGVGGIMSVVIFYRGSESWISKGAQISGPSVLFMVGSERSEFPSGSLITKDAALAALEEFYQNGRMSKHIRWQHE